MSAKATISEADLCAAFIAAVAAPTRGVGAKWTAYPETAGFDILLIREGDGFQIGVEAKLSLNAKVVAQALPYGEGWHYGTAPGPDCRAVLVPFGKCNEDVSRICAALGITVIRFHTAPPAGGGIWGRPFFPHLPDERTGLAMGEWHPWAPAERCPLPDYIPDVAAGVAAPSKLSEWKVKAIRLAVLLDDRPVTRADFRALQLSPTLWLGPLGWLEPVPGSRPGAWVRCNRTPDFERQHPTNYGQIRADKARWAPAAPQPVAIQGALL